MRMEDLLAAQKEAENYKNELELVGAEKIALDQMLVESLKSCINIRRDLVKANIEIERLKKEVDALKQHQAQEVQEQPLLEQVCN